MSAMGPNPGSSLLEELVRSPASGRLAVITRAGAPVEVLASLSDEAERSIVTGVAAALESTGIVTALADEIGHAPVRARARRARARAMAYAGRLDEALDLCNQVIALADQAELPLEAAQARLVSMHALGEQGRFDEAIAAGESARQAFLGSGERALAGRAETNIGTAYQRRDDPTRALEYFNRARAMLIDEPVAVAQIDSNRGEALLAINDYAAAETAFESALQSFESRHVHWAAAIVTGNLADLCARQGRLHDAMDRFERARRHLDTEASSGHRARLIAEQAEAMALLGLPEEAAQAYDSALASLESAGLTLEMARARTGYAMALLRLGRAAEAERELAAAIDACDRLGHGVAKSRAQLLRAQLLAARGETREAQRIIEAAVIAIADRPADLAVARYHLAMLALASGDLTMAETQVEDGLRIAAELQIAPLHADLLHARSRLHRQRGQVALAIADLYEAIEHVERVRGSLQAERFRAAFLADRLNIYEELVRALLDHAESDAVARAFAVAEKAKSRSLLDVVRGVLDVTDLAAVDAADAGEAQLLARIGELRRQLNALYSRLADDSHGEGLRFTGSALPVAIRERERELDELERRISATRGAAALLAPPIDFQDAAGLVSPDCALIEYFAAGDELLAFVILNEDSRVLRGLSRMTVVNDLVRRLQFQINRVMRPGSHASVPSAGKSRRMLDDIHRELRSLHDVLLGPIESALAEVDRVTIVPHGSLHLVPFHALWDGRRHLIESHEVSSSPSSSLLALLADQPRMVAGESRLRRAVVVGLADAAAPSIADEALAIASTLRGDCPVVLIGADATVDRVCQAAQHASVLHLACHGRFSTDNPRGSGLKLADRWLTVRDIYRMKLSADLVTLSGCETGRNVICAGDELMGLLRGFFAAGAASLLVSLWRVNDESAMELMRRFYSSWHTDSELGVSKTGVSEGGGRKATALRAAQLDMKNLGPHPAYWAPFALVGKP